MNQEHKLQALSVEYKVDFGNGKRKAKPKKPPKQKPTKLPRITRLLALAHHLQDLLNQGAVKDYADIAKLSGLSRSRVTQIMNLTLLAPQIQEKLFFPSNENQIKEQAFRRVLKWAVWQEQVKVWKDLKGTWE